MLEEFRELVRAGILRVTPENEVLATKETPRESGGAEKPEGSSREEDVAQLDRQLLEWLEKRRQQKAEEARRKEPLRPSGQMPDAAPAGMRQKVVERLAQKILDLWDRADQAAEGYPVLRDQVVERVAEEILRRWQRGPE